MNTGAPQGWALIAVPRQAELEPDIWVTVTDLAHPDFAPIIMIDADLVIPGLPRYGPGLPHLLDLADVVMLAYRTVFLHHSLLVWGSEAGVCLAAASGAAALLNGIRLSPMTTSVTTSLGGCHAVSSLFSTR